MKFTNARSRADARIAAAPCALAPSLLLLTGCGKEEKKDAARPPVDVTALTVAPRDVPVTAVYVAQTQSSQAVNIQARVSGFLDKRVYIEGSVVKAGQVLFRMDQKPFQAQVDGAAAALQRNQAALEVAQGEPRAHQAARAAERAVAEGPRRRAGPVRAGGRRGRAVEGAARVGASSTSRTRRSRSPVDGVSAASPPSPTARTSTRRTAQLTTVSVLTPMWINFSVSENEMERIRNEVQQRAAASCPTAASSSSRSSWSTARCSRTRARSRSPIRRTTRRPARS